jgi:hypothetical protein
MFYNNVNSKKLKSIEEVGGTLPCLGRNGIL